MHKTISTPPTPFGHARHRDAWPPPPPAGDLRADPDPDDERARREALAELSDLIAELERWRRRQAMRKATEGTRWVFARAASGAAVRVRFVDGEPVELRAGAADRDAAVEVATEALDRAVALAGPWERDGAALDWYAPAAFVR